MSKLFSPGWIWLQLQPPPSPPSAIAIAIQYYLLVLSLRLCSIGGSKVACVSYRGSVVT
jgi:hypothetical protein